LNRILRPLTVILLFAALCSVVLACGLHPKDPDKIRFATPPVDVPDPFNPQTQVSTLTIQTAVRRTEGLGGDERRCDPKDLRRFHVRAIWTIFSGPRIVAKIEKEIEVVPPFRFVDLPASHGRGRKPFIVVPDLKLTWDGRSTRPRGGALLPEGLYRYAAEAEFIKVQKPTRGPLRKDFNDTATAWGSVTIKKSIPLTLSVTSPTDGVITQGSTVTVAGSVTGSSPLTVKVNQTAVPVSGGSFSTTVALTEGSSTITVVATDGTGQQTQKTLTVTRDSVAPSIAVTAPTNGSVLASGTPAIAVTYSDPSPSGGLDTSTFTALLDGSNVAASFSVSADGATYTPSTPLAEGSHTVQVTLSDRAGNSRSASSTFTVDTRAPELTMTPPAGTLSSSSALTVAANYVDPTPGSGIDASSFGAILDQQDVSSSFTVGSSGATLAFSATNPLSEGSHVFAVKIRDLAGNLAQATTSVTVDTVAPLMALSPKDGTVIATATPTLSATYVDPSPGSGLKLASFRATLDGTDATSSFVVGSVQASYPVSLAQPLAQGEHLLVCSVADQAGHSKTASSTFLLDTRSPSLTIVMPAQGATLATTTPKFEVTFLDPMPGSGLLDGGFAAKLDGQDITTSFVRTTDGATFEVPVSAPLLIGTHVFQVQVSDRAGFVASAQSTFSIVTQGGTPGDSAGYSTGVALDGTTGLPLSGVTVTIKGVSGSVQTNDQGQYAFPVLDTGNYLLTFSKAGYTRVQRWVKIVKGRDSAVKPPRLIPLDSKKTLVRAAVGGVVTNSSGHITLNIPAGALPSDVELQVTDLPNSTVLPNDLPPESQYLSCFTVDPDISCSAPVHVTYRVRTNQPFPAGTQIPVGHYDMDRGAWSHAALATIAADGYTAEADLTKFSAHDINPPVHQTQTTNGATAPWTRSGQVQTPAKDTPRQTCQECGSAILNAKGSFLENHVLPSYSGQRRPLEFVYLSHTAAPSPLLRFETAVNPNSTVSPSRSLLANAIKTSEKRL